MFPKQDVSANDAVCEGLTFNPYHSIEAHQPVGAMNKGRYWIYKASRAAASLRGNIDRFDCDEIYPDFDQRLSPTPSP